MQFNEFEYHFACRCKVVHLCFIAVAGPPLQNERCTSLLKFLYTVSSGMLNSTIPYHTYNVVLPRNLLCKSMRRNNGNIHHLSLSGYDVIFAYVGQLMETAISVDMDIENGFTTQTPPSQLNITRYCCIFLSRVSIQCI